MKNNDNYKNNKKLYTLVIDSLNTVYCFSNEKFKPV